MIVLLLTVLFTIVFGVMFYIGDSRHYDLMSFFGMLGVFLLAFCLVAEIIIIIVCYSTADADKAENEQIYEALIYKAETEQIRDEFGIVNKSYVDEVQEWNQGVTWYKTMQRNAFIGIFIPNIYDDFKIIDLNSIEYRDQEVK